MPHPAAANLTPTELDLLKQKIAAWAKELGFQKMGVSNLDLGEHRQHLQAWLDQHFHGDMAYMTRNVEKRFYPEQLVPNTVRILALRMDYLPEDAVLKERLNTPHRAYISRYALGRDYHKLMRKRIAQLAKRAEQAVGPIGYRAFVDSAPVLEKAIAEKAGLGWIGKHTLLLDRQAGSWFFLGELFTDLPLPTDEAVSAHCGSCTACIDICPTAAIVAPYQLDARRCISYLTIEHRGVIPVEFRRAIGNRVFGCDDCQIICPWNKFAKFTQEADFTPRHLLDQATLLTLFEWDEETFLENTQGSPIRRAGYEGWLRNLAIGLGNAPYDPKITTALQRRRPHVTELVLEHIDWAIAEQGAKHHRL